ncbi:hypothetical protein L6164_033525 [Bauhinia variegata]|uniref:Uncharacterized protein n=1 Tax=Bauhinia variegata TaxID=167791 RepID=A0ACB9KS71_BAUVA|nr:hypothetical protein L6164_033525 [Bauhinia variegata]
MADVPSLISLCIDTLKEELVRGDDVLPAIPELPFDLIDILITRLPPLALTKLQNHLPYDDQDMQVFSHDRVGDKRKRGRDWNLDVAWRMLFKLRWPNLVDQIQTTDWQQVYWETHLQNCLDVAAERALIPSFNGYIGDIQIPDTILKHVGFDGHTSYSFHDHSKLSYHCLQFGCHARCLRLQNVLCTAEISDLLRECKLRSLVLGWIRSKEQIDGLCKLLAQHSKTLTSLEFFYCSVSSDFVKAICDSVVIKGVQRHGIEHLSINSSSSVDSWTATLPSELVSFLSSGRSLCSLKLSNNDLRRNFAQSLFMTLLNLSSGISVLDLSENHIAGWLSDFNQRTSRVSHLSLGIGKSLQLLRVLNLRGNFLKKDDLEGLRHALAHMPNLENLDISDNFFKDEGIRNLIPYFVEASETCSPLADLKLENCELSCDGVYLLLDALSTFKGPLKSLSIAENFLGSEIAATLGKFLDTSIQVLNIGGIGLGPSGFRVLQDQIKGELKLVKINISKNRGGIETAKFLSRLLSHAPQLTEVNAAFNLMPIESLTVICSALKVAKGNLEHLDLTGHVWDYTPTHASLRAEFLHNGKPILILPSSPTFGAPYDDDP